MWNINVFAMGFAAAICIVELLRGNYGFAALNWALILINSLFVTF